MARIVTPRAYSLRLHPEAHGREWSSSLWATHELINRGARVFGELLLTLRGGLSASLADGEPARRPALALGWLSVESQGGVPAKLLVPHDVDASIGIKGRRTAHVLAAILRRQGADRDLREDWIADCRDCLEAPVHPDAVWVDRSRAFDDLSKRIRVDRSAALSILADLLGEDRVLSVERTRTVSNIASETFFARARSWLSRTWGTGEKEDREGISSALSELAKLPQRRFVGRSGEALLAAMLEALDLAPRGGGGARRSSLHRRIGWKGRPSAARAAFDRALDEPRLSTETLAALWRKLEHEAERKRPALASPPWAARLREAVEDAIGLPFVGQRNHIGEYAVMLDLATRRLAQVLARIRANEGLRKESALAHEASMGNVPPAAREWLDAFVERRADLLGAAGSYRIRPRAIAGWKELSAAWDGCRTRTERIRATRAWRAESVGPDVGDAALFESLAEDDAWCVRERRAGPKLPPGPDAEILISYVEASESDARRRRIRAAMYRHPDALAHPEFAEFGDSRLEARFDALKGGAGAREAAHGVSLDLWNGRQIVRQRFHWSSRRFQSDVLRHAPRCDGQAVAAVRGDRLGRAAAAASSDEDIEVRGPFAQRRWGARLQASRDELSRLARQVGARGWDERAQAMRDRITFRLVLAVRLEPSGPWIRYQADVMSGVPLVLAPRGSLDEWRGLAYPFWHPADNRGRQGRAKHLLSRLPGVRILAVSLGLANGAACAVWQALDDDGVGSLCRDSGMRRPGPMAMSLRPRVGPRVVVLRRVAAPGGPATWARLDRQFRIVVDDKPRLASEEELLLVHRFERDLGCRVPALDALWRSGWGRTPGQRARVERLTELGWNPPPEPTTEGRRATFATVDGLVARVLRSARLALRRHGRIARVAHHLARAAAGSSEHLAPALESWRVLIASPFFDDAWARELWASHVGDAASSSVLAESSSADLAALAELWSCRFGQEDVAWRARLRALRGLVLPHGKSGSTATARGRGGLSDRRLAAIGSLHRLLRAYAMRPTPSELRANATSGDEAAVERFGTRILESLSRLKVSRERLLVNRVVGAALGLGPGTRLPEDRRFSPCHAVVIGATSRPLEGSSWAMESLRERLAQACQLHGLHLREVSSAYAGLQDAVTGAPGVRCRDVTRAELAASPFWRREVERARRRRASGRSHDRDLWLLDQVDGERDPVRLMVSGGALFVSADPSSPASGGVDAATNLAANLGLRAITDPDWPGAWWYVPVDGATGRPVPRVAASAAIGSDLALGSSSGEGIVNLWRDASARPLAKGIWRSLGRYLDEVERRVVGVLRRRRR